MKRFILPTIILAALAVGCAKSNIIESSPSYQETIEFESYAGRVPVTKATTATIETLQDSEIGFQAIAYSSGNNNQTYLNEKVWFDAKADEGKGKWTYGDKKAYWPETTNLDFVAYGLNAKKKGTVTDRNGVSTSDVDLISGITEATFTYSVPDAAKEQADLVIAEPWLNHNNIDYGSNKVTFNFKHVLSKIGFSLTTNNDNSNPVNVTIKNVSIKGTFYNKGIVHLLAQTPNITPADKADYITSYSLFGHKYPKVEVPAEGEEGEEEPEDVLLDGFVCLNTEDIVPIYPNIQFNADEKKYKEVDVPSTNDAAVADRFMMIIPGTVGKIDDIDNIDGDAETTNIDPYIEVVYQLTGGADMISRAFLKDYGITGFDAGKWYEFIFKVSTTAVKFEVDITQGWNTEEDPLGSDEENTESNS
jgi:hypothetical protein